MTAARIKTVFILAPEHFTFPPVKGRIETEVHAHIYTSGDLSAEIISVLWEGHELLGQVTQEKIREMRLHMVSEYLSGKLRGFEGDTHREGA